MCSNKTATAIVFFLYLSVVLHAASAPPNGPEDLVQNPGFEILEPTGDNNFAHRTEIPDDSNQPGPTISAEKDPNLVHSRYYSCKIDRPFVGASTLYSEETLEVEPNTAYEASVFVKTEGVTGWGNGFGVVKARIGDAVVTQQRFSDWATY